MLEGRPRPRSRSWSWRWSTTRSHQRSCTPTRTTACCRRCRRSAACRRWPLIGGRQEEIKVAVDPTRLAAYGVSLGQVQAGLAGVERGAARRQHRPGRAAVRPAGERTDQATRRPGEHRRRPSVAAQSRRLVRADPRRRRGDGARGRRRADTGDPLQRAPGDPYLGRPGQWREPDRRHRRRLQGLPALREGLPSSSQLIVVQDSSPFVRSSLLGIEEELATAVILTSWCCWCSCTVRARADRPVLDSDHAAGHVHRHARAGFQPELPQHAGADADDRHPGRRLDRGARKHLRHLARGEPPRAAAINGRSEIGLAAVAITLVDVVVFAPTGLVSGQIGAFFKEFGFTIAAATLFSLIMSFTLTPMLASPCSNPSDEARARAPLGALLALVGPRVRRAGARYQPLARLVLAASLGAAAGGAGAVLVCGMALVATGRGVHVEFIPQYRLGLRSRSAPRRRRARRWRRTTRSCSRSKRSCSNMPEVQSVTSSIGVSASGLFGSGSTGQARFGSLTVELKPLSSGRRGVDGNRGRRAPATGDGTAHLGAREQPGRRRRGAAGERATPRAGPDHAGRPGGSTPARASRDTGPRQRHHERTGRAAAARGRGRSGARGRPGRRRRFRSRRRYGPRSQGW